MKQHLLLAVALAALGLVAFWPVLGNDFVSYDDPDYVTENAHVLRGVSLESVQWALQPGPAGNWHPVTWLSHMLDVEFFGLNAAGHHAVSLILHLITGVLLFFVLLKVTRALWPSWLVAALFLLHPTRVESVAWIAERKDVLSALFLVLTVWAYAGYVRSGGRKTTRGTACYALALCWFALGLMSKPMLVTVPFVLLLLDFWPLGRARFGRDFATTGQHKTAPLPLALEKVPFLVLAAVSSWLTFLAQKRGGAIASLEALPLDFRVSNAVVSYARYLGKGLWPTDLTVIYPLPTPREWPFLLIVGCAVVLVGITGWVLWGGRKRPYLAAGWFWYLGMLVPVIGLVQVGQQAMADRYTYLPYIGLFIIVAWSLAEWVSRWPRTKPLVLVTGTAALVTCVGLTRAQTRVWRDTIQLFGHAVAVTTDNAIAENNLGSGLVKAGRYAEAEPHLEAALRIRPSYSEALVNLALVRQSQGNLVGATELLERASQQQQPTATAHYNLGNMLMQQGNLDAAERQFRSALELKPEFVEARYNLGVIKARQGQVAEAISEYEATLKLRASFAEARLSLGALLAAQKRYDEAIAQFRALLNNDPANADAHFNLAGALEGKGDAAGAAAEYAEAARLRPEDLEAQMKAGLSLFSQGQMAQAATRFQSVLETIEDRSSTNRMLNTPSTNALAQVHHYLAIALHSQNRLSDALPHYNRAAELNPSAPQFLNDLAWILATHPDAAIRNGPRAVELSRRAADLTGNKRAAILGTLAAAYAETGRFSDAILSAEQAIRIASEAGEREIVEANKRLLELYKANQPARQ